MDLKRIAMFGGTFNPPHMGHVAAACACVKLLKLDELILVPAGLPPHKLLPSGSATAEQRLEMTRLMASMVEKARVWDVELKRPGKSYTVDTVRQLAAENPGSTIWLIVGTDMFMSFERWQQPEEIARLARLAVVCRDKRNGAMLSEQSERLKDKLGVQTDLLDTPAVEVSSTDLRQHNYAWMVPPEIDRYIREQGLYQIVLPNINLERLREYVGQTLSEKRLNHTIGCEQAALSLAERYGENEQYAQAAAILHDATKDLSLTQARELCRRCHVKLEEEYPPLIHGQTAAALARDQFEMPEEVVQAIACHTAGAPKMSRLGQILFLADKMEPTRRYPGVDTLRKLAFEDLDEAMCFSMESTIRQLEKRDKPVCPLSRAALDFFRQRII